ncbi:MAG: hypothetical protein ISS16_05220 [Ignavibacteria bacterium]|nr:hypothetical protein [Ignavibacteria bacterium]
MKRIIISCIILIISFAFITCSKYQESKIYEKEIGEINLDGKDLILTIPSNEKLKDKYIRFYIATFRRSPDVRNFDALEIGFYDGNYLLIYQETAPGAFDDNIYKSTEIKQDKDFFYLEIPNRLLFEEDMKLWSAYDNEIIVDNIRLNSKKTGKIDINDPYLYILLTK